MRKVSGILFNNLTLLLMRKFMLGLIVVVFIVACGEQQSAQDSPAGTIIADTVNAPRLVSQESDSLVLTAETGKAEGPAIKYMPEWRAFGWFTSSDSVLWDVNVSSAGEYDVIMEWSVDDGEAGKEFVLSSGANQLVGKVGKSGSWEVYKTENIGTIKLEHGRQTIVFKSAQPFSKDSALLDLRNLKFVKRG
ncbi:MAG: hypothetical protein JNK79_08220 [Chitinophagaceae bacterium]|nr:hypothetical protein [Chitinophagaceae bacterium]